MVGNKNLPMTVLMLKKDTLALNCKLLGAVIKAECKICLSFSDTSHAILWNFAHKQHYKSIPRQHIKMFNVQEILLKMQNNNSSIFEIQWKLNHKIFIFPLFGLIVIFPFFQQGKIIVSSKECFAMLIPNILFFHYRGIFIRNVFLAIERGKNSVN